MIDHKKVRVRFAPSPTGPLHMGGVRTALYNYLFAKKHQGDFILRIEDTDQQRFVAGAEEYIIASLKWCGILPNEGVGFAEGPFSPYRQSERKDLYKTYVETLIRNGHAYYAFDTASSLDQLRKEREQQGSSFAYGPQNRHQLFNSLNMTAAEVLQRLNEGTPYVVRIKVPENDLIVVHDLIRGEVEMHTSQMDDKVLFKSDGMPTYHLANVVDDHLMEITHVIRGEEWLPSAPLHVLLYKSFGWESTMPKFAHLPLLLKPDGNGKLSKRDGDRLGFPVFPLNWTDPLTGEQSKGYKEQGYIPEAFVNMLAHLGWHAADDQEIYSMEALIEAFSLERVSKSGAKFDPDKTKWYNEVYLRSSTDQHLAMLFLPIVQEQLTKSIPSRHLCTSAGHLIDAESLLAYCNKAVALVKDKAQFINEFWDLCNYLFVAPITIDTTILAKKWKPPYETFFIKFADALSTLTSMEATQAEKLHTAIANDLALKPGEVMQLLRIMVSGQGSGVNLFEMIALLGGKESSTRIEQNLKKWLQTLSTDAAASRQ
ncbi:MAG: hypothetical protein RIQ89_868 [Bacteroidota bacterium]|jgi:glutamyl-tRNA synthetase